MKKQKGFKLMKIPALPSPEASLVITSCYYIYFDNKEIKQEHLKLEQKNPPGDGGSKFT
jgi:hypothetical protein